MGILSRTMWTAEWCTRLLWSWLGRDEPWTAWRGALGLFQGGGSHRTAAGLQGGLRQGAQRRSWRHCPC